MKRYRYVGPPEIAAAVVDHPSGEALCADRIGPILAALDADDGAPCTYVVDADGRLRLADRASEHVACAGGGDVLAAGEIAFEETGVGWRVAYASNQSTGYCPEPTCWVALAAALDALDIEHDGAFTRAMTFRRCESCGERNLRPLVPSFLHHLAGPRPRGPAGRSLP